MSASVLLLTLVVCLCQFTDTWGSLLSKEDNSVSVVCYWRPADWQTWRPYQREFTSEDIPVSLCDYLVYGVGTLNTDTWTLESKDTYTDFQLNGINNATGLKDKNPQLKVEYSLGSWFVEESLYIMAADTEKRKLFINSSVAFLTEHNFDGLHLHWGNKGPNVSENTDTDKKHLTALLKDMKEAFMKSGLILTLSIWGVLRKYMDDNFDIGSVYTYTDLVHVHTYGYHGGWESVTGSMAPLSYSKSEDGPINHYSNVENTWKYLRQKGAHPNKTIIVVPFKGSAYVLKDLNQTGKYAPAVPNSKEKLTWKYDHPLYHELCVEIQKDNGWVLKWDSTGKVPYMYKGNQWISYENRTSVEEKASFVVREKLGGLAVDNIGRDDVKGVCSNVTFPLLKALHNIRSGAETTALRMVILACSLAVLYLF